MFSRTLPYVVLIAVTSTVGIFAWLSLQPGIDASHIKLNSGKYSMDIGVTKGQISFRDIVNTLFSREEKAREMQVLLEDAIERLDYDHPVAKRLRELQEDAKGPFQERFFEVKVSFTDNPALENGSAAVCKYSEFYKRRVMIFNKAYQHPIPVMASHSLLLCNPPGTTDVHPIIQIHFNDGKKLYGEITPNKQEDGIAQVVPEFPLPIAPEATRASTNVTRQL